MALPKSERFSQADSLTNGFQDIGDLSIPPHSNAAASTKAIESPEQAGIDDERPPRRAMNYGPHKAPPCDLQGRAPEASWAFRPIFGGSPPGDESELRTSLPSCRVFSLPLIS